MNPTATALLIGGIVVPVFLHVIASDRMPWWPDTVTLGIAFGVTAALMVWKSRKDRELNRRVWNALRGLGRGR
ncbi:MAG TPA: hypothetical protein VH417_11450 [Vicinamibacterales bacterium]|jgi:peptidoglycan/LPS O-acetylase OafA/YrhL